MNIISLLLSLLLNRADVNIVDEVTSWSPEDEVKEEEDWLLMFIDGPECEDCNTFESIFTKVANKFDEKIKSGLVDCKSTSEHQSLCSKLEIKKYPSIKFHRGGKYYDYVGSKAEENLSWYCRRMIMYETSPSTEIEMQELLKAHPEELFYALAGTVSDTVEQKFLEIAYQRAPDPMSPTFIRTTKEVFPHIEEKSALIMMNYKKSKNIEPNILEMEDFIRPNWRPRVIDLNMWWPEAVKKAGTLTIAVVQNVTEKRFYLKEMEDLDRENKAVTSTGKKTRAFGFFISDGGELDKILEDKFTLEYSNGSQLIIYDKYKKKYKSRLLDNSADSRLRDLWDEMILSSEWKNIPNSGMSLWYAIGIAVGVGLIMESGNFISNKFLKKYGYKTPYEQAGWDFPSLKDEIKNSGINNPF